MPKKVRFMLFVALLLCAIPATAFVSSQSLQTTCTVATPLANHAVVRVHPGEDQRSLTYLFPGREYPVTGFTVAPDGSEWWSLDRAEFASRSLESDPWVSAAAVSSSGDCDAVEASGNSSESTLTPTPTATRSIISVRATLRAQSLENLSSDVRQGVWSMSVNGNALTCVGVRQTFDENPYTTDVYIDTSVSPGSLLYNGNLLIRGENGVYQGVIDWELDDLVLDAEISLEPISETTMNGLLTANADPCVAELMFDLTYSSE